MNSKPQLNCKKIKFMKLLTKNMFLNSDCILPPVDCNEDFNKQVADQHH